ncbi:hypothetical protein P8452_61522 [Trifolium repens]|nr:hypothetical protein P8452_61522 [Trifolium repens]
MLLVTYTIKKKSEIPDFIKRVVEFQFLVVLPETLDGKSFDFLAVGTAQLLGSAKLLFAALAPLIAAEASPRRRRHRSFSSSQIR